VCGAVRAEIIQSPMDYPFLDSQHKRQHNKVLRDSCSKLSLRTRILSQGASGPSTRSKSALMRDVRIFLVVEKRIAWSNFTRDRQLARSWPESATNVPFSRGKYTSRSHVCHLHYGNQPHVQLAVIKRRAGGAIETMPDPSGRIRHDLFLPFFRTTAKEALLDGMHVRVSLSFTSHP
jgi:hypothetical protein